MKWKALTNIVTSRVGRQVLTVQKHSPVLLFAAGVAGVVTTVVLASRATMKLEEVLDEHSDMLAKIDGNTGIGKYTKDDARHDKVVLYVRTTNKLVKLYGPAVLVGLASVAALTGSHVVLNRRLAGVTAAYAAIEKGFAEYRRRVVAEYGSEKDREFRYGTERREIIEETDEGPVVRDIQQIGKDAASVYARFFDECSKSWSREQGYNQIFLRCQQNYANDLLKTRGHVFLNEVYDMLGLERSKAGAVVGWILDGCDGEGSDNYIDFGVFEGDMFSAMRFVNGDERSILLDFNVDGIIYDKI